MQFVKTGPPRLPIFGTYPFLLLFNYKHVHKAVEWLCGVYKTDLLGLHAMHIPTVVGNTTEVVREMLNNQALDGKPMLKIGLLNLHNI